MTMLNTCWKEKKKEILLLFPETEKPHKSKKKSPRRLRVRAIV